MRLLDSNLSGDIKQMQTLIFVVPLGKPKRNELMCLKNFDVPQRLKSLGISSAPICYDFVSRCLAYRNRVEFGKKWSAALKCTLCYHSLLQHRSFKFSYAILLVDCKRLEQFMAERPDSLTIRGEYSLQSTSRMGIRSLVITIVTGLRTVQIALLSTGAAFCCQ